MFDWLLQKRYSGTGKVQEPRYKEGPRDWQNLFAKKRSPYIEVLFLGLRYTEVPLYK